MDDTFRIGTSGELVAAIEEFLPQLRVIVNLSVQHDPNPAVLVRDRLVASDHVYDAQPAKTEANSRADKNAIIVRSTMDNRVGHSAYKLWRDSLLTLGF